MSGVKLKMVIWPLTLTLYSGMLLNVKSAEKESWSNFYSVIARRLKYTYGGIIFCIYHLNKAILYTYFKQKNWGQILCTCKIKMLK